MFFHYNVILSPVRLISLSRNIVLVQRSMKYISLGSCVPFLYFRYISNNYVYNVIRWIKVSWITRKLCWFISVMGLRRDLFSITKASPCFYQLCCMHMIWHLTTSRCQYWSTETKLKKNPPITGFCLLYDICSSLRLESLYGFTPALMVGYTQ